MREAKARVPSATVWAARAAAIDGEPLQVLLRESIRSPDPFLQLSGRWVIRRLASDTDKIKIDVKSLPRSLEIDLAELMGAEVANVHCASADQRGAILEDLRDRPKGWLLDAARRMAALTERGYKVWRKSGLE